MLAGVNGAGKSSIGGAMFRESGADYYNPDEAAKALIAANPGLEQTKANAAALALVWSRPGFAAIRAFAASSGLK